MPKGKGLLLGIDVGTSGLKALLLSPTGRLLGSVLETFPLDVPRPGWAQQDPNLWWKACIRAIRGLLGKSHTPPGAIAAIGLTGQMHGSVFLDPRGRVLTPALLWCDQRTFKECEDINDAVGGPASLLRLAFNPALTGFTAPKILWVRKHLPQVYRATSKILLPKDFVRFQLTGHFSSDVADASGTLLFDVRRRRWSRPLLKALRIPARLLPDVQESPEISGTVSPAAARATGLLTGTPVVAGAGDQAAGAIGCGIIRPGVVSASLGTSGVVFAACDLPEHTPDGRLHLFCSAVSGGWHLMGVMLAAGGSFRWFRDELGKAVLPQGWGAGLDPYDALCRIAGRVPAGAEGLVFLPYLTGERTPHADPNARGVFFGLSLKHTAAHLTRAVLEGVTFGMRDSLELIRTMGVEVKRIRLSGGGARNRLWCEIQAAMYHATCARLRREEGPALGSAILAGLGAGIFRSYQHATEICVAEKDLFRPDHRVAAIYDLTYSTYRRLYPALKPIFAGKS